MRAGYMKAVLVTAAVLAVGYCSDPRPPGHQDAATPAPLTRLQACNQLLGDLARHEGVPDIPTLRRIADHVTVPRMAADARTAVRDIGHTGAAQLDLGLLRDECARAGVQIPAR